MFIVLEGIDGTGKTTAAQGLAKALEEHTGVEAVLTKTPGGEPAAGDKVRDLVLNPDTPLNRQAMPFMFLGDMIHVAQEVIFPALAAGKHVVCDRWMGSTYVYNVVCGDVMLDPMQSQSFCECMTRFLPQPDLTVVLDISVEAARKRLAKEEFNGVEDYFERQGSEKWLTRRAEYLNLQNSPINRGGRMAFTKVDNMSRNEVVTDILNLIDISF